MGNCIFKLTFLGSVEKSAVLRGVSDLDDLGSSEKLHDETRGNNWRDSELHKSTTVGGHDDTKPVERIGGVGGHDSEERNLTAHQKHEEGDGSPEHLLTELDLPLRFGDLRHEAAERLHEFKKLD